MPRLAVVVASAADPPSLRAWLHPIASFCSEWSLEIIVVRNAPMPDVADWGPSFAAVRFIPASGNHVRLRREGARATDADSLFLTNDMESGAYRRLVCLAEALRLQPVQEAAATTMPFDKQIKVG